MALSSFVEINSLVLILPLRPLANKLLVIAGLGKGLKIEQGKPAHAMEESRAAERKPYLLEN